MPLYSVVCKECKDTTEIHKAMLDSFPLCELCGAQLIKNWKKDKPVITWRGPGAGKVLNKNAVEVEEEMYNDITEEDD